MPSTQELHPKTTNSNQEPTKYDPVFGINRYGVICGINRVFFPNPEAVLKSLGLLPIDDLNRDKTDRMQAH